MKQRLLRPLPLKAMKLVKHLQQKLLLQLKAMKTKKKVVNLVKKLKKMKADGHFNGCDW